MRNTGLRRKNYGSSKSHEFKHSPSIISTCFFQTLVRTCCLLLEFKQTMIKIVLSRKSAKVNYRGNTGLYVVDLRNAASPTKNNRQELMIELFKEADTKKKKKRKKKKKQTHTSGLLSNATCFEKVV